MQPTEKAMGDGVRCGRPRENSFKVGSGHRSRPTLASGRVGAPWNGLDGMLLAGPGRLDNFLFDGVVFGFAPE